MKRLLILTLLAVIFISCKKEDPVTLIDPRTAALIWQLDAYSYNPGSGSVTELLESERTIFFWEEKIWSNGDLCNLNGPVGELERVEYDPINSNFTVDPCFTDTSSYSITWPFRIDEEREFLYISHPWCVEGCSFRYRKKTD